MKYHFIGIAGSSMSGLANVMKDLGNNITGCDLSIGGGHNENHITKDLDRVIISAAVTPDSKAWPEVKKAKRLGIPIIRRSKLIGQLMHDKIGIAVAGSHGKTTVSAMITLILQEAKYDPMFFIGGDIPKLGSAGFGKGKYLVAEACEWDRQFLDFRPKIVIITNIDKEHLDTYPEGLISIQKAFKKFVKLIPKNGLLVLKEDDPYTKNLIKIAKCKVRTFSLGKPWPGLSLKIPGKHNILNATAAARVCHEIGVPQQTIKKMLNNFTGVKRRFEIKGEKDGILVIDDYAHHPSEIKATLSGVREFYPKKRVICIFQPHQYSRTEGLFQEFAAAFSDCDQLIINDIFEVPGRDPKNHKITTHDLVNAIKKSSQKNTLYLPTYEKIVKYLIKETRRGDLIITLGATKIYEVGERFLCTQN